MSTSFISHSPSPSAHSHLQDVSIAESYPSRCASPLLPMGQQPQPHYHRRTPSSSHHQSARVSNRQSQQSVIHKNYAIPEEEEVVEEGTRAPHLGKRNQTTRFISYYRTPSPSTAASGGGRRTATLPRPKSYRITTTAAEHHQSSVRDLSSKLKSACRKLNPKRLTKHGAHQDSEEPPLPELPHAQVFVSGNAPPL
ncbi:hypothetical protein GGI20_003231 [Coemansia sp. BCRC 34301]|nr:hypothetical protein GGI20_003231 [Coemansia sp. BCRC 34301]